MILTDSWIYYRMYKNIRRGKIYHCTSIYLQQECEMFGALRVYNFLKFRLFDIIANQYGDQKAFEYFMASNEKAPLTIRVNPIKTTREELMKQMKLYHKKTLVSPFGLILSQKNNINLKDTEQFRDGLFEIQDEASQICALRVKCQPKQKVLDYCCGSGGKTLAFAHQMQNQGLIEIYDTREDALIKAKQRFKRAGIQNYQHFSRKYKFDWILLDVPCSGLGTLRRNPDIKYKVNKRSLIGIQYSQQELTNKQQQIFRDAIPYLNRDGYIVYTTCSFVRQENEDQVKQFCRLYGLQVVDCFQSFPEIGQMDSFFSVTLQYQQ
ncbi:hypothetical protein pb186bvf_016920 [Paramecium bursaria]